MSIKPFTPGEAVVAGKELSISRIPDFVVAAVNELLAEEFAKPYHVTSVRLMQNKVIAAIIKHSRQSITRSELFHNKWMDFEVLYREQGWKVSYDNPAYNESYEPSYEFSRNE